LLGYKEKSEFICGLKGALPLARRLPVRLAANQFKEKVQRSGKRGRSHSPFESGQRPVVRLGGQVESNEG